MTNGGKVPGWDKLDDNTWQLEQDIPTDQEYPYIAVVRIIDHGKAGQGTRYEIEMAVEKKLSDISSTKVDGYLIDNESNISRARKISAEFRRNVQTPEDIANLNLPYAAEHIETPDYSGQDFFSVQKDGDYGKGVILMAANSETPEKAESKLKEWADATNTDLGEATYRIFRHDGKIDSSIPDSAEKVATV